MIYDAVIVGGGLSGLAAAISVANDGGTVALDVAHLIAGGPLVARADIGRHIPIDQAARIIAVLLSLAFSYFFNLNLIGMPGHG